MKKINILLTVIISAFFSHNLMAQDMNGLTDKQKKIATISANTAIGNLDALKQELNAGLDAGLTINEIKEVLIQMYAYAGFPRSLQGINTFMSVLEERKTRGINDTVGKEFSPISETGNKYARGKETLQQLTGRKDEEPTGANAFAPAIDVFLKEHLFADIFDRDVLTYPQRELATISALTAMPEVEPMLNSHISMGKNMGLTDIQLQEINSVVNSSVITGIFPQGNPASPEQFTGKVWIQSLVKPQEIEGLYSVGQVTFEPEGKTNWHTHPAGQVLLITEGKGWYQERGKAPVSLKKGDIYVIPKDVEHWHGATNKSKFVHIAISNMVNGNNVTWMSPVTDEEYYSLHK